MNQVFVFTTIREHGGGRLPNVEQDMAVLEAEIVELQLGRTKGTSVDHAASSR